MTTDVELDRMYEAAIADEWEEQNREDPEREAIAVAIGKAVDLMNEARDVLDGAIDEDSKYFDRIVSFCSDIEDLVSELKKGV